VLLVVIHKDEHSMNAVTTCVDSGCFFQCFFNQPIFPSVTPGWLGPQNSQKEEPLGIAVAGPDVFYVAQTTVSMY